MLDELSKYGKPIIVLNLEHPPVANESVPVLAIAKFDGIIGAAQLRRALLSFSTEPQRLRALDATFDKDGSIEFDNHGTVLIRSSYGPGWEVEKSLRTVFWATPCHLLVFSDGRMRLAYR